MALDEEILKQSLWMIILTKAKINADLFFDLALQFLIPNLLRNDFNKLDVTDKNILAYQHQNLGFQFFDKGNSGKKILLLENKNANYSGNWIDMSGLTKNSSHNNSEIIIVGSLDKILITKLVVNSNDL